MSELDERLKADMEANRVNPNPRLVWLINFAIEEIMPELFRKDEYAEWLTWASSWKNGQRSPRACVNAAHRCFDHKGWGMDGKATNPVWHCLGQIAWGAKEACYNSKTSGWLVVRYVADAMLAFGIAFPADPRLLLDPPTIESTVNIDRPQLSQ